MIPVGIRASDLSSLIAQGDREHQQDAVRIAANPDGSWVIAVADGTGGGINANDVAPAAVSVLPQRIASEDQMTAAFAVANRAARKLGTPESRSRLDEDLDAGWTSDPDTTLAVASCTPEGGLLSAWVGDSMPFIVPLPRGRGWHGPPQDMAAGNPLIGEFAAPRVGAAESLIATMSRLSDTMSREDVERILREGAIIAVLSDGAYKGYMNWRTGNWFTDRPDDNSLGFLLSEIDRSSASRIAKAIMRRARRSGLHDNASVVVARLPTTAR